METPEFEGVRESDFDHVKHAFWGLNNLLTSSMNVPDPIQPNTVLDWCNLTGNILSRDEIKIVFAMDVAYRAALNEAQSES